MPMLSVSSWIKGLGVSEAVLILLALIEWVFRELSGFQGLALTDPFKKSYFLLLFGMRPFRHSSSLDAV